MLFSGRDFVGSSSSVKHLQKLPKTS